VKLGDYYYYGMGTEVSMEAAASQYRIASDKLSSPQAMFNLGYMYEHGAYRERVVVKHLVMLPCVATQSAVHYACLFACCFAVVFRLK